MKRIVLFGGLTLVVAAGVAWWLTSGSAANRAVVTMSWRGSHGGEAVLPAEIAWCPVTRMGTLAAISNDTGLYLTLQEADSLTAAPHPIVAPDVRANAPRPSAIGAVRWAGDSGLLLGFQSVSGLLDLQRVQGTASGRLEMRMRAPVGFDTLVVEASFEDLPIVASALGCP